MKKYTAHFLCLVMLAFAANAFSQSARDKHEAYEKTMEAIEKFDKGKTNDAISLLKEAIELDPKNAGIQFELALCYIKKKDYPKAISILEKIIKWEDVSDQCYQQLGNCYDLNGNSAKAVETYNAGLEIFPYSGFLYVELGNTMWNTGKYEEAIKNWELGIRYKPSYSSNYYHAATVFLNGGTNIWGLVYGEIFLYLEDNSSPRWQEISAKMYQFFNNRIFKKNDSTTSINILMIPDEDTSRLAFEVNYNMAMMLPLLFASKENFSLKSLADLRSEFIKLWFEKGFNERFPNALMDFDKKMLDEGLFDEYNKYIFLYGNKEEFSDCVKKDKAKYEKLAKWLGKNKFELNSQNAIYRGMYSNK